MRTSVTSITFRTKKIQEICTLAQNARLDAIEWGGDIHVPPGDRKSALEALHSTKAHGLLVSAYGSYYRCCEHDNFSQILETALLLETSVIRVWAGSVSSGLVSSSERGEIVSCLREAVHLAASYGCQVVTEYHANTLTDTLESAKCLLEEVPGLRTLWQPPIGLTQTENLMALKCLGSQIEGIHVYHWDKQGIRRPLLDGEKDWTAYFAAASRNKLPRYATLEFVRGDNEQQFYEDAGALHQLLTKILTD